MIPGYYINLDKAVERRHYMDGEISRLGLPIERLSAVDGKKLSAEKVEQLRPEPGDFHLLSPSEVACYMSHQAIWKIIAQGSSRFGAVFEDDIQFSEEAPSFLLSDNWIPQGVDAIKIETSRRWVKLGPAQKAQSRQIAQLKSRHLAAGGYILSKALAARLVEQTRQVRNPVDYDLFDSNSTQLGPSAMWQLSPALCVQQVRAGGRIFLPQGANASDLDAYRGTTKRTGLAKIKAELSRPFGSFGRVVAGKIWAAQTGGQYKIIPFE